MLSRLLGRDFHCSNGRVAHVETRLASVRRGALADTADVVVNTLGKGPIILLADEHTWAAAGSVVYDALVGAGVAVSTSILTGHPVAGPDAVNALKARAEGARGIVAVGSGTINDIAKSASTELGISYVAVGTALSMNGYTSSISALLVDGVKRTLPSKPPVAVVIDLDVCAAAPRVLTLAGLGDMLSKPFSEADWRLSHHVLGEAWFRDPGELLGDTFDAMVASAPAIGRSEPEALDALAHAILLSGLSMTVAGASSPASGGEHLFSHYWDMLCYSRGDEPHGLHGTQVGVACCLIEPLHHAICALGDGVIDVEAAVGRAPVTPEIAERAVRRRHDARLPKAVVDAIVSQALQKWVAPHALRERLERLNADRKAIFEHVRAALLPYGAVRAALVAAGAPVTPSAIHPELDGGLADWAVARDMRSRYTVLDLAAELAVGNVDVGIVDVGISAGGAT